MRNVGGVNIITTEVALALTSVGCVQVLKGQSSGNSSIWTCVNNCHLKLFSCETLRFLFRVGSKLFSCIMIHVTSMNTRYLKLLSSEVLNLSSKLEESFPAKLRVITD